jgi:hypothetical protein
MMPTISQDDILQMMQEASYLRRYFADIFAEEESSTSTSSKLIRSDIPEAKQEITMTFFEGKKSMLRTMKWKRNKKRKRTSQESDTGNTASY